MKIDATLLSNKEQTQAFVEDLLRGMLFRGLPNPLSMELYGYLVIENMNQSIEAVFKHAKSKSEIIFLNALMIGGLLKDPLFLFIQPPLYSASDQVMIARNEYAQVMDAWNYVRQRMGEVSMIDFIELANTSKDVSEYEKDIIKHNMQMAILDHCGSYILSIGAIFKNIQIGKNPLVTDIFVWSISQPHFKLLIECDEVDYQLDKSAFTNNRSRDRYLQSLGFQVFRFSTAEILSSPTKKAWELVNYLEAQKSISKKNI